MVSIDIFVLGILVDRQECENYYCNVCPSPHPVTFDLRPQILAQSDHDASNDHEDDTNYIFD